MDTLIKLNQVYKIYNSDKIKTTALNNVSLNIKEHSIVGLIGANGAGKSTLLKLISGHITSTSGVLNITRKPEGKYSNICLMKDIEKLLDSYKVKELLKVIPTFYKDFDYEFFEILVKTFNINKRKSYEKLSKGQQGAINLSIALASRAYITLLDETYISLDAPSRNKFFDILLEDFSKRPRTIIISTHYIDEVSNLFDDIILIDNGKIIVHEEKDVLEEKTFTILGDSTLGQEILKEKNVINVDFIGKKSVFSVYDTLDNDINEKLLNNNFDISITPLEKWFIQMIEKEGVKHV